jgi:hypothetical protein
VILWTSKVTTEKEPAIERLGVRSWRWVLEVAPWTISVEQQMRSERYDWHPANHYARVDITDRWHVGMEHGYYDGPHCQFSIVWLHVGWSLWACEKCMPRKEGN